MLTLARKYSLWLVPVMAFTGLLALSIATSDQRYIYYSELAVIAVLGLYLAAFKKELLLATTLFTVPLSIVLSDASGTSVAVPAEPLLLVLSGMGLIYLLVKPTYLKKILYHPLTVLLMIDLGWLIITSVTSSLHLISLKRVFIRFHFLMVFYFLVSHWSANRANLHKLILLYAAGLVWPILSTFRAHSRYNFDPRTVYELCKPYFADHTSFGAAIAFVLPMLVLVSVQGKKLGLAKPYRIGFLLLTALLAVAEVLAFSRAAWLSLGVAMLMYVFIRLRGRFWSFLLVFAITAGGFWHFRNELYDKARENEYVSNQGEITEHLLSVGNLNTDASNLERINRWLCAYRMGMDKPITGFGPGTYQFQYGPYQSVYEMTYISTLAGDRGNAHSEPLTAFSESGVPGLALFLIWTFATIGFGLRAIRRARDPWIRLVATGCLLGFITFFFHGLVNAFLDQAKMAALVFGSMGVLVAIDALHNRQPESHEAT